MRKCNLLLSEHCLLLSVMLPTSHCRQERPGHKETILDLGKVEVARCPPFHTFRGDSYSRLELAPTISICSKLFYPRLRWDGMVLCFNGCQFYYP